MIDNSLPKIMKCEVATRPLRIGFVYSRLPFPMMRGDQLTVSHLLSFLSARGHQVDFFTLDMDGFLSSAQKQWLSSACRSVHIYPQTLASKISGIIFSVVQGAPLQVGLFRNLRLARDVRANIEDGKYDVVYAYYLRSAVIIPPVQGRSRRLNGGTVSILAMQLSQTLNTERLYQDEDKLLKRLLFWIEWHLLAKFESKIWRNFTRVVLIGPKDVEAVQSVCRERGQQQMDNWVYGAHGTDTHSVEPAKIEEIVSNRVVFSGSMLYAPNVQAVLWFADQCWPMIRAARPTAEFVIQGRDPLPAVQRLHGRDGIIVTGTVNDVATIIRSASVCIAPIRAAGGMQNKLIEYMACGKAVVTTSIANEGIMAPSDTVAIADGADDFAKVVLSLLADSSIAQTLGRKAREYVMANWTWEAHFLKLEKDMYSALDEEGFKTALDIAIQPQ